MSLATATREDLVCFVTAFQMYGQVITTAYDALRSHEVDYRKLPEYKEMGPTAEQAIKLKPKASQELIVAYLSRLENAIKAACRRKQAFALVVDNTPPTTTKH